MMFGRKLNALLGDGNVSVEERGSGLQPDVAHYDHVETVDGPDVRRSVGGLRRYWSRRSGGASKGMIALMSGVRGDGVALYPRAADLIKQKRGEKT